MYFSANNKIYSRPFKCLLVVSGELLQYGANLLKFSTAFIVAMSWGNSAYDILLTVLSISRFSSDNRSNKYQVYTIQSKSMSQEASRRLFFAVAVKHCKQYFLHFFSLYVIILEIIH